MRRPLPADVASRLGAMRPSGDGYVTRCPAHDDNKPSLSLKVGDDGKVLAKCHAGCDQGSVMDALAGLGITPEMMNPNRELTPLGQAEWTPHGPAVAVYDYRDAHGVTRFQVLRTADKQFPQRRPDPTAKSGWRWNLGDVQRVLYRLPELIEAVNNGEHVWICEGEKDVEALRRAGQAATCNPGGAGKWRDEYSATLAGVNVTIVADKDAPGQAHARRVAESLEGLAESVRIVEAPDPHKDAAAYLRDGGTLDGFLTTAGDEAEPVPDLAPGIHDFLAGPDEYDWIVPGVLERPDRLILTGFEGFGKSYLVRQMAVAIAAGIHPFRHEFFTPVRVLFVDCENSDRQTRRHLRKIVPVAGMMGHPLANDSLRVIVRPQGVDLTSAEGAAWLLERVTAHRPDVLFIGSLYKLHERDPADEMAARMLTAVLDRARTAVDCAVVIEAHAGHGNGVGPRNVRPIGSSLYLRWPEHGIGLAPFSETDDRTYTPLQVKAWRGSRDRDISAWPEFLEHGEYDMDRRTFMTWPWVEYLPRLEIDAPPQTGVAG
jgi:hypothetical protein